MNDEIAIMIIMIIAIYLVNLLLIFRHIHTRIDKRRGEIDELEDYITDSLASVMSAYEKNASKLDALQSRLEVLEKIVVDLQARRKRRKKE